MKFLSLFIFISLLINPAFSQDVARGEKLYKKCIACHGKSGEGKKAQQAPRLSGQYDWYLYTQLVDFKSKKRVNPKMYPFIKNLSSEDFKDLSAYISQMK